MQAQADMIKMHRKGKPTNLLRSVMDMGEGIDCKYSGVRWGRCGLESKRETFLNGGEGYELVEN